MKKLFLLLFFFSSLAFSQRFQLDWNDNIETINKKMKKVGASSSNQKYIFFGGKFNGVDIENWFFQYSNDSLTGIVMKLKVDDDLPKKLYFQKLATKLSGSDALGEASMMNDNAYFWKFSTTTTFSVNLIDGNEIDFMFLRTTPSTK